MNWLGQNWKTTIGGLLMGIPPILTAAFMAASIPVPKWEVFASTLAMGIGGLVLGTNAKDSTTHSTAAEVDQATNVANVEAQLPKK